MSARIPSARTLRSLTDELRGLTNIRAIYAGFEDVTASDRARSEDLDDQIRGVEDALVDALLIDRGVDRDWLSALSGPKSAAEAAAVYASYGMSAPTAPIHRAALPQCASCRRRVELCLGPGCEPVNYRAAIGGAA